MYENLFSSKVNQLQVCTVTTKAHHPLAHNIVESRSKSISDKARKGLGVTFIYLFLCVCQISEALGTKSGTEKKIKNQ